MGVYMVKISIIIATYNSEATIRQTLNSIRYQTYPNVEVIVVDGKSVDRTVDIIRNYDDVVTRYISEEDCGIYNAFNKGLDMITGEYVVFIGSDDCLCDYEVLEKVAKHLTSNVNVLSTPIIVVDNKFKKEFILNNIYSDEDVLSGAMIPHPGLYVKSEILKKYKFNEGNKIISDYEFLLRYVLDGGKVKFLDFPTVYFSNGGISSGEYGSNFWIKRFYEHVKLFALLNLEERYLYILFDRFLSLRNKNTCYYIKELIKIVLKKWHLYDYLKAIKNKKHNCSLKYCRWCNRYEE